MPGLTAHWAYTNIGKPVKGETIFVSAASGAVGQIVAQLAKVSPLCWCAEEADGVVVARRTQGDWIGRLG